MTKTVNINENMSIETVIALIENGDEVVIEKNGKPIGKFTPIEKPKEIKQRVFGLGKGTPGPVTTLTMNCRMNSGVSIKDYEFIA